MDLNVNMLRREARTTAGAGPVGVSLEASDQAQARPSEQMIGFGAATAPFRGKLYAVWKGGKRRRTLVCVVRRREVVGAVTNSQGR